MNVTLIFELIERVQKAKLRKVPSLIKWIQTQIPSFDPNLPVKPEWGSVRAPACDSDGWIIYHDEWELSIYNKGWRLSPKSLSGIKTSFTEQGVSMWRANEIESSRALYLFAEINKWTQALYAKGETE